MSGDFVKLYDEKFYSERTCKSYCERAGQIFFGSYEKTSKSSTSPSEVKTVDSSQSQTKESSQPQPEPQQQKPDKEKNTDKINPFEKMDKTLKGLFGR